MMDSQDAPLGFDKHAGFDKPLNAQGNVRRTSMASVDAVGKTVRALLIARTPLALAVFTSFVRMVAAKAAVSGCFAGLLPGFLAIRVVIVGKSSHGFNPFVIASALSCAIARVAPAINLASFIPRVFRRFLNHRVLTRLEP